MVNAPTYQRPSRREARGAGIAPWLFISPWILDFLFFTLGPLIFLNDLSTYTLPLSPDLFRGLHAMDAVSIATISFLLCLPPQAAMDAALAFDQFATIFAHQHASGLLPDFVNDREVSSVSTKPPVHGWSILQLAQADPTRLQSDGWLTAWNLATESPRSPLYEADGHGRGPIQAPTNLLLWDRLRQQNQKALANDIARRFLKLCESAGMAGNFDSLTGVGLRYRTFTWASAVSLWLAASLQSDKVLTVEATR